MQAGTKVRLTKVGAVRDAKYPTPMKSEYVPGADNGAKSLPLDYESVGTLRADVKVGNRIVLDRTHRNGIAAVGELISSAVTGMQKAANGKGMLVFTENSMYRLEEV